ncbi:hypothetical protein P9847_05410 [Paenibacillus chibensis]|uniref:Uncharacterized protein n=1 Tax=Paenibacillus chibensis TaxID=59846 RepID=A0ABU6PRI2_9BACL|nr:hypothetical protein [Paenibacillus chibensis]
MKKVILVGCIIALAAVFIRYFGFREKSILSIKPSETASVEMYNASSPASDEVQMMRFDNEQDVADVFNQVSQMKPSGNAKPLDGNYTLVFHQTDGSQLTYVYSNGVVRTSNGFEGRVQSDNILNRLWAKLHYPVQPIMETELPSLQ